MYIHRACIAYAYIHRACIYAYTSTLTGSVNSEFLLIQTAADGPY